MSISIENCIIIYLNFRQVDTINQTEYFLLQWNIDYPRLVQPNDQLTEHITECEAQICEQAKMGEETKGF